MNWHEEAEYAPMLNNGPMCEAYRRNGEALGKMFIEIKDLSTGSSDMGNVSQIVPKTGSCLSLTFTDTAARPVRRSFSKVSSWGWYMMILAEGPLISRGHPGSPAAGGGDTARAGSMIPASSTKGIHGLFHFTLLTSPGAGVSPAADSSRSCAGRLRIPSTRIAPSRIAGE